MNLIGIVVAVLIAVAAGGYALTRPSTSPEAPDTEAAPSPSAALDAAEDAKAMMEKADSAEGEMMKDDMMKDAAMEGGDAGMMKKDDAMTDGAMMKKDEPVADAGMMKKGSYIPYDSAKLAMAESGDVVLFFRASWCPSCKTLDGNIKANAASIPGDLTILDVNYDTATDLKKKYGVTYQHTLVQVDASGNLIKKWSGSPNLADIVAQVE